jgi:hypothetical protein
MIYHAIISMKDRCAVIRPSNHGVNDIEWHHGCRTYKTEEAYDDLEMDLKRKKMYDVLTEDQWRDYIVSLDDPTLVPSNKFINAKVPYDKWDSKYEIY